MDLFAFTQANGVLPINVLTEHNDFSATLTDGNLIIGGASVLNGDMPFPPPVKGAAHGNNSILNSGSAITQAPQLVEIGNGDAPFPPPNNK